MEQESLHIGAIAYKKFDLGGESGNSLMLLLDWVEDLSESMSFEELIREITDISKHIMKTEASLLMLPDEDSGEWYAHLPVTPVHKEIRRKKINGNQAHTGWVVQHKIPLIINDAREEGEWIQGLTSEDFRTKNLICAPLLNTQGKIIGLIQVANRHGASGFEEKDLPVFQALAKHVAKVIEKNRSQGQIGRQLREKDLLLSELHHRMRNNLSLITGMVEMERSKLQDNDPGEILKKIQSRIQSVNSVYELLSSKGMFDDVELASYLRKIIENIADALSTPVQKIKIMYDMDEFSIHPERALSCGLIINELLVNSFKHAFKYKNEGTIIIELSTNGKLITLKYQDDGIGLPEDLDLDEYESLGFRIIHALVEKLDGALSFDEKNRYKGLRSVLEFPVVNGEL